MQKRAILTTFNIGAAKHNDNVIARLPTDYKIDHSFDAVKDEIEDGLHVSPELQNSLSSPDLPRMRQAEKEHRRHAAREPASM
jgi:hypothetical protein